MKPLRSSFILACLAAVFGAANAQPPSPTNADSHYVSRMGDRYLTFAGSPANFEALAVGLRHGTPVTLSDGAAIPTLTPIETPTRPMGYGNVTRAIDLASRQLAAAGITNPTPAQIQAAMMGGDVTATNGGVTTLQGVLDLRSQGMGWGQIAHTIGVHPGLRSGSAAASGTPAASGITTAAGSSVSGPKLKGGSSAADGRGRSGIVTGAGGATAAGGSNAFGQGHSNAFGQGHGNAFGRGGKP